MARSQRRAARSPAHRRRLRGLRSRDSKGGRFGFSTARYRSHRSHRLQRTGFGRPNPHARGGVGFGDARGRRRSVFRVGERARARDYNGRRHDYASARNRDSGVGCAQSRDCRRGARRQNYLESSGVFVARTREHDVASRHRSGVATRAGGATVARPGGELGKFRFATPRAVCRRVRGAQTFGRTRARRFANHRRPGFDRDDSAFPPPSKSRAPTSKRA